MSIRDNLLRFLDHLHSLPDYSEKITVLAVSKTKPVQDMLEVFHAGHCFFGENRIQEAGEKKSLLPTDVNIQLIGPVQSNKVKYCPALFDTIHSVDSFRILDLLEKRYASQNKKLHVFIQMNLCDEKTKSGITEEDTLFEIIEHFKHSQTVSLKGLMTIPDPTLPPAQTSAVFAQLRKLRDACVSQFSLTNTLTELSMGMSGDYESAIAEGSTCIRIGSLIFGKRQYTAS